MMTKEMEADLNRVAQIINEDRKLAIAKQIKIAEMLNSNDFSGATHALFSKEQVADILNGKVAINTKAAVTQAVKNFQKAMLDAIDDIEVSPDAMQETQNIMAKYVKFGPDGYFADDADQAAVQLIEEYDGANSVFDEGSSKTYVNSEGDAILNIMRTTSSTGESVSIDVKIQFATFNAWADQHILVSGDHLEFVE